MKQEYINPFLVAAKKVVEKTCSTQVTPGKPSLKNGALSYGALNGVIELSGADITGSMIISFEEKCIIAIVNKMTNEKHSKITPEVVSAVGEFTNMISAGAKKDLFDAGLVVETSPPVTLEGQGLELKQLGNGPCITFPFSTEFGSFVVETNLSEKKK